MGASSTKLEPLKPVDSVPVRQLFGTWFVIAVMPTIFEKGAHNAIETYSAGKTEGAVDIDFRYNKNALDGPLKKLPQTGSSWFDDQTAGWKVSPFWPVKMPYLVIEKSKTALDNDAAWFVVGTSASSNVASSPAAESRPPRHRRDVHPIHWLVAHRSATRAAPTSGSWRAGPRCRARSWTTSRKD